MHLDNEEIIPDLVKHINNLTNDKFDMCGLKQIGDPAFKDAIHDTTSKFFLPGVTPETDAVLMVSRKEYPDSMDRAANNTRKAQNVLSSSCSGVVVTPIIDGYFAGLSFVVWPKHQPLSSSRIIRKFQKKWLEHRVFSWLIEIAKDSMVRDLDEKSIDQYLRSPLECVALNLRQSDNVRSHAKKALQHLNTKQWKPVTILQHSDFWLGNILLLKKNSQFSNNPFGFCVIDWGGALTEGAPIFDMVRFCISSGISLSRARKEFLRYSQAIGVEAKELIYFLICALGLIGMNLEQFPENRYLKMCEDNVLYLESMSFDV